jgi:hypothetical protein
MLGYSGDGGPALMAQFSWARGSNPNPSGGIVYHEGKLYISDTEADVIRVMDLADGTIAAFAGTGEGGDSGDDGPALGAQLNGPRDLEIGPDGDLYFADTDNSKVRAIDLEVGVIRTVVGTGELGVEEEEGKLATEIRLRRPFGIAFDPDGNLYVMDTLNSRIVKVARERDHPDHRSLVGLLAALALTSCDGDGEPRLRPGRSRRHSARSPATPRTATTATPTTPRSRRSRPRCRCRRTP